MAPRRSSLGQAGTGGGKGQQRWLLGHGGAQGGPRSEEEPGRKMATVHGGDRLRPRSSQSLWHRRTHSRSSPLHCCSLPNPASTRGLVQAGGAQPGSGTASAGCWAGIHAESPGAATAICPGLASGCLSLLWILSLLTPLSAVQASFSKVKVVVISLQIFKLNYIYIYIYIIYINIYFIFFALDEAEKGYPLSHTHAAVKYKPLGKAQVRARGAGTLLFLADGKLEGRQEEKPNTQAMPGEGSPRRRCQATTSGYSRHLAGTKVCPWDLLVLCFALLQVLDQDFTSR